MKIDLSSLASRSELDEAPREVKEMIEQHLKDELDVANAKPFLIPGEADDAHISEEKTFNPKTNEFGRIEKPRRRSRKARFTIVKSVQVLRGGKTLVADSSGDPEAAIAAADAETESSS